MRHVGHIKASLLFPKKKRATSKEKMWNVLEFSLHPVYASYKRRDEELVADAVRGATVVWNIRPVMLAAYALTTNIVYIPSLLLLQFL